MNKAESIKAQAFRRLVSVSKLYNEDNCVTEVGLQGVIHYLENGSNIPKEKYIKWAKNALDKLNQISSLIHNPPEITNHEAEEWLERKLENERRFREVLEEFRAKRD